MKNIIPLLLAFMVISMKDNEDRKVLVCNKWIQFAFKPYNATSPNPVSSSMAKECVFGEDGSYSESMYDGMLKMKGKWFLNGNQTKMAFTFDEMNGQKLPEFPNTTKRFDMIILRLTKDTLIYGNEAYYGKNLVYGHDDWYFIREN